MASQDNSQPLYSDEEDFLAFVGDQYDGAESGSDIDELEPPSDSDDAEGEGVGLGAGGRGPWIPVVDMEEYEPRPLVRFNEELAGPVNPPPPDASPELYFLWMCGGESLIRLLVDESNRYAAQHLQTHPDMRPHARARDWYDVTDEEIKAFIGLLLVMGVIKKPSIESYWNDGDETWLSHTPAFGEVMTRNRFQAILRFLHCANNHLAPPRGTPRYDPLYKIEPVIALLNECFSRNYTLGKDVSVDERMVGFKGRHELVQYMPNKRRHPWGIKLWIRAEANSGYTHRIMPYRGKQYTHVSPDGLGHDVVCRLVQSLEGSGRHIVCDRFFTSPRLFHDLFTRGLGSTGTVLRNRRGLPASVRRNNQRHPPGTLRAKQQGPLLVLEWRDRRPVILLTTVGKPRTEQHAQRDGTEKAIPLAISLYNQTMGGVDLGDQLIQEYSPDMRQLKMWKRVLLNGLTTASVNAYIVYRDQGNNSSRLRFMHAVCTGLIGTYRQQRQRAGRPSAGPQPPRLTGRHFVEPIADGKRRQCVVCGKANRRTGTYKGTRITTQCRTCVVPLCQVNCFRRYHTLRRFAITPNLDIED